MPPRYLEEGCLSGVRRWRPTHLVTHHIRHAQYDHVADSAQETEYHEQELASRGQPLVA
jgi:hypothetical protein